MSQQPLTGAGTCEVAAPLEAVWAMLLDPETLHALIPGTERVTQTQDQYEAWLSYGTSRFRARYHVVLTVSDAIPPTTLTLAGHSEGGLGWGRATAFVTLSETATGHTSINWRYEGVIGGPVALLGGMLLRSAARVFVGRFFTALAQRAALQSGGG